MYADLKERYELGFQDLLRVGQGLVYIALRVQHEQLDQTNLSNGLDAILKAVGNRHSNEADRWGPQGPCGPTYRPTGPTRERS